MSDAPPPTLLAHYRQRFGDPEQAVVARAPGRVNLIGEHTDYNDGLVLPMTIDRSVWLALRPRDDRSVRLYSLNYTEGIGYALDRRPQREQTAAVSWSDYVTGAIEELRQLELLERGFEGVLFGDVPLGAGLSSSAALTVATVVGLQQTLGFELGEVETAKLCQRVEHRYAGVQCGIMDQFAARVGRAGHALFLDCRSLDYRHVPLPRPERAKIVIVHSGVKRELAASKYNERRDECQRAVGVLQRLDPAIESLRDADMEQFAACEQQMSVYESKRARHVIGENQRVRDAAAALDDDDLDGFGQQMYASHLSLKRDYDVSCAELDLLVEIAKGTDGVFGARMTGGGFGGCTVNLVAPEAIERLRENIDSGYRTRFQHRHSILVLDDNVEAGRVATVL